MAYTLGGLSTVEGEPVPHIVYYVAATLDGYIADPDGGFDFLDVVERPGEDYGYADFFASVDALLMGRKTYEVVQEFGTWHYGEVPCHVLTSRPLEAMAPSVHFTPGPIEDVMADLEAAGSQRVWLVGGGELVAAFREKGLVDEYIVSIVPVLLGQGIPLLGPGGSREDLMITDSRTYESGLVQLTYLRKEKA